MNNYILALNVLGDFIGVVSIITVMVVAVGGAIWMTEEIEPKKIKVVGLSIILLTVLFSFVCTITNLPQLTVKSNIQLVKMRCFEMKDVKDIAIITRRIEGVEKIN